MLYSPYLPTLNDGWVSVGLLRRIARCAFVSLLLNTFNPDCRAQATYYVAADGNDNNDGRSSASPLQSLGKVNGLQLQAGDQVLFRRGDTFRGTLSIRRSGSASQPLVFDAYGSGAKPILTGSVPVGGWSSLGGGVWQATCSACGNRVTGLYRNGREMPLGRYPNYSDANRGYLTIQSHQNRHQIISREGLDIDLNTGWVGTEVVIRATQWITDRYNFDRQAGNALNLTGYPSNYGIQDNWGFFVQNHPATLDQPGEWAFNPNTKTLRLYSPAINPNHVIYTATVQDRAVELTNVSNVTLRNLRISESLNVGLFVQNGSNLTFSQVEVMNSGENGVAITGSGHAVLMENSIVYNANNNGIGVDAYQNVTLRGNLIRRVGIQPGRGKSGDGQYNGVSSQVNQNLLLEHNVVDSIGYNGISFATNTTIRRNVVSNYCLAKSDGGGIYTWNGNHSRNGQMRIQSNIVYNSPGVPEGTPGGAYSGANGIYLDDCTLNADVRDNTVFNCHGFGIYLHATNGASVHNNTVYNNTEAQLAMMPAGGCPARNNQILSNILVGRVADQLLGKYESNANDIAQYGTFDYNHYVRPFEDVAKIRIVYRDGEYTGGHFSLAQWQGMYGKDMNSYNSPITYAHPQLPDDNMRLLYNSSGLNKVVTLTENYRDAKGQAYSGSVTLAPFTSLMLLKDNGTAAPPPAVTLRQPENPANAVAGLNYQYYEGNWSALPNFDQLTALRTGASNSPDLAVRGRNDYFSLRFTGYVNVPTDGMYTFYTTSDDGSKLYIGNTEVVNNDGGHASQERLGLIGLKAGKHAITVVYFQNISGQELSVSYSGPNLSKQVIPTAAFFRVSMGNVAPTPPVPVTLREPDNPANAVTGLDYRYYEGNWSQLPDFANMTPVKTGTAEVPDISVRNQDNFFGLRFTGYVEVPADGTYTFFTNSDDGSKLFIGSTTVVSHDGTHPQTEKSGSIGLKAGKHAFTLLYFEHAGGEGLSVSFEGPGLSKQIIPAGAFYRINNGTAPVAVTLREPENPANAVAGLDYQYYEGNWSQLPNFNSLTPVKTGTASTTDLSVRSRNEYFGLRFTGYVNIPTDGTYTFFTNSDDGSKLFIGSTEVVNNDGGHPLQERSGSIGLKAGKHAVTIVYFDNIGGEELSVSYSGPNLGKQIIPAGAFFRVIPTGISSTAVGAGTGLRAEYFNSRTLTAPLVLSRVEAVVDNNWGDDSPAAGTVSNDNFSARWTGQVEAPVTGNYTFSTVSDDGVRLWVNGTQVINNWTGHAPTVDQGRISLVGGQKYDIRLEYFENGAGAEIRLRWEYPGQGRQPVPQSRLYPAPAAGGSRVGASATVAGREEAGEQLDVAAPVVYPVPARDEVRVRYYADVAGAVTLQLVNSAAQAVKTVEAPVVRGENHFELPVGQFSRGLYVLTLTQGGRRISRKVVLGE